MTQPHQKTNSILVTGGSGFVGSHLVEHLISSGIPASHIHITHYGLSHSLAPATVPESNVHSINLTDEQATENLLKKIQPNQIYHLAAIASVSDTTSSPIRVLTVNTQIQVSLLEAIRNHAPTAKTLIVGSAQEYDFTSQLPNTPVNENHPLGPANPYGISKVTQDLLALSYYYSYNVPIIRVRPFNHIGERQTPAFAIPAFAKQIAECEKKGTTEIKVGNLDAIRDFTDVKDVVAAYTLLMKKGKIGDVYNIGSGNGYKMKDILNMLIGHSNAQITVRLDKKRIRPIDVPSIIADNSKITSLGWIPKIPITNTLGRVLTYWKEQI